MLIWLFSFNREITVRVEASNGKALEFMERCGWRRIAVEQRDVIYLMTPGGGSGYANVGSHDCPGSASG